MFVSLHVLGETFPKGNEPRPMNTSWQHIQGNLFEFEIIVVSNPSDRAGCEHRNWDKEFKVAHHEQSVRNPGWVHLMFVLPSLVIKTGPIASQLIVGFVKAERSASMGQVHASQDGSPVDILRSRM